MKNEQLISLTADIVAAHVMNNNVAVGDVPNLVERVHRALAKLGQPSEQSVSETAKKPAVSIRSSLKSEYITCLECGSKQKTMVLTVSGPSGGVSFSFHVVMYRT